MKNKSLVFVCAVLLLAGCSGKTGVETNSDRKIVDGKITGKIGEEFILQLDSGDLININSRKYKMEDYVGKQIKAEGMYSGSTLYIDQID